MDTLIDYALSFVGLPYIWGGDDPVIGFDCSGLVQEILASVGMDPPGDQTADALYRHFLAAGAIPGMRKAGALALFGTAARVTHIGFLIDSQRMVEAGGGGSATTSAAAAAAQNAYIRVRPVSNRKDLVTLLYPEKQYKAAGLVV